MGRYTPFLIALFVVGSGASILETAANPLIAQFGDPSSSERRLNFAQAFNPPGTILGVALGTWFIFSGVEKSAAEVSAMKIQGTYAAYLHQEILRVVPTYVALGLALLLLAICIAKAPFPHNIDSNGDAGNLSAPQHPVLGAYARLLRNPQVMTAVAAQFFYVGAQVGSWSNLIPYMRAYTPISDRVAGYWVIATLIALGLGRVVSTPLMQYIAPARMTFFYAVAYTLLLVVAVARPGFVGGSALVLTSFFMSIMYPTIFALGVKGLGDDTKLAGSLLMMAILGGALFPSLMGWIARQAGSLAMSYTLPLGGYLCVATYAFLVPRLHNMTVSRDSFEAAPRQF